MKLYSYVIDHDFGFAPNPFYDYCTLATCKPVIRRCAKIDDYIVGTGSSRRNRSGHLVFFMKVDEVSKFNDYWLDSRFEDKKPFLHGSKMRAYGDNIYHRDSSTGIWIQENSLHSLREGIVNSKNLEHDTQTDRILIGSKFTYWGGSGPIIPSQFRNFGGEDICATRGHRNIFSPELFSSFLDWVLSLGFKGQIGVPLEWRYRG